MSSPSILDKSFVYRSSVNTDVRVTWAKARRRLAAEKAKAVAPKPVASVTPLARKVGK